MNSQNEFPDIINEPSDKSDEDFTSDEESEIPNEKIYSTIFDSDEESDNSNIILVNEILPQKEFIDRKVLLDFLLFKIKIQIIIFMVI